jgi:polyvinyl alcohol dehydrogenase (cytochrome)
MIARRVATLLFVTAATATPVLAQTRPAAAPAQASPGQTLFDTHCSTCHGGDDPRIPSVASLRQRTPESIVDALTTGVMRQQGTELRDSERATIAEFLTGRRPTIAASTVDSRCVAPAAFQPIQGAAWSGWGPDGTNARFQAAAAAGLTAESVPRLKLKWAFGFPGANTARAQPTVAGGRVFVGSQDGTVYSLDAKTGCTYWTYKAKAAVRSAITIGLAQGSAGATAYFGDGRANVYALNAATGELVWTQSIDTHPSAHVTSGPTLYQNRLFVSVASGEEGQGNNPRYECCTFRGSVVALNTTNGAVAWKTYTIAEEPRTIGRNAGGAVRWGPAGAGIWGAPTVDPKRRLVYAATGNMYTEPQQKTSDAVIAFEMDSGRVAWVSQRTEQDVFVVGCNQQGANCPASAALGPDFDFGNAPMLTTTASGRDLIVIGQKSAVGWALDPDQKGAVVWEYQAGRGSALGGMEFGSSTDGTLAFFPLGDGNMPTAGEMHAVNLETGQRAWMTPAPKVLCGERGRGCSPAILAAISSIPGVVFAGSQDGGVRAYASKDGAILWEYDTNRPFPTVNGVQGNGASMSGPGPAIAGGMVFLNSGYGSLGGRPGNVLLAFGVE